jgi:hypothetical protein
MPLLIRPAKLLDAPAIVSLAVESVSQDPLPVTIDKQAMYDMAQTVITSPAHFCWVGEQDGVVVSALAAMSQKGFWFERQQCSVLLYYSRVNGGVLPLMRKFASWVKERPAIKLAVFELEPGCDPRLARALSRLGFARTSVNATYVRSPK